MTEKGSILGRTRQELTEKESILGRTRQELTEKGSILGRTRQELTEKSENIVTSDILVRSQTMSGAPAGLVQRMYR